MKRKGGAVKFPNLVYAISLKRLRHYEIAQVAGISEWRFSRLLNGRSEVTAAERDQIARALGFDRDWLFQTPKPPKSEISEGQATTV